jgi:HEPN domain-containing protein
LAANHLLEKGDYSYALFFGHVTVEKLPKAVFVDRFDEPPPFTPEDFKRSGNFIDEIKKTGKVI